MQKARKLYCYVDETGQDTEGRLFIAAAIMTDQSVEALTTILEGFERDSGKRKVKWRQSNRQRCTDYVARALTVNLPLQTYYRLFSGRELPYELATIATIASAINTYCDRENIVDYKATVIIDGLPKSLQHRTAKLLRNLGVRTKSVRGEADETNAMLRLADAVAGLTRAAYEGDARFGEISESLEKQGIISKL